MVIVYKLVTSLCLICREYGYKHRWKLSIDEMHVGEVRGLINVEIGVCYSTKYVIFSRIVKINVLLLGLAWLFCVFLKCRNRIYNAICQAIMAWWALFISFCMYPCTIMQIGALLALSNLMRLETVQLLFCRNRVY